MSEAKSRFKIRNGDIELEYEGPVEDVRARYKEAFDWLKTTSSEVVGKKPEHVSKENQTDEKRKGTRGPEIWSPAIDDLIKEGFFRLPNRRQNPDVVKALADKALPVKGKADVIRQTLTRKVKKGDLKGTRGSEGWSFWTE